MQVTHPWHFLISTRIYPSEGGYFVTDPAMAKGLLTPATRMTVPATFKKSRLLTVRGGRSFLEKAINSPRDVEKMIRKKSDDQGLKWSSDF